MCPTAAIGAMFSLASCVSAQVREKPDDPLNYFIGGCAGGLTLGVRSESATCPSPPRPPPAALSWTRGRLCRALAPAELPGLLNLGHQPVHHQIITASTAA